MFSTFQSRITVYVVALGLAAAAFIAGGIITWNKRIFWTKELRKVQAESLRIAEEYRAGFLELNVALLRHLFAPEPNDATNFADHANIVSNRLAELQGEELVPESRDIVGRMAAEFAQYRKHAEAAWDKPSVAQNNKEVVDRIEAGRTRMSALNARLHDIQGNALNSFVTRARKELDWLFGAIYACMVLLLVCTVVLARVVYRDLIAPLRRTVQLSSALLERQEKLNALGLLTAGLAHEIRNPLNSIKARLFTQRRVLGEQSPGLEDNRFIDEEVDRLEAVLVEALQFARPSEPAFQRVRIETALRPLCELLEPSLRKTEIKLATDFQASGEIHADPNQIKQAVLNLVKNSAESIGRGGTITLRTRPAVLRSGRQKRRAVALEIDDTGQGIPPELQARLFDPFFTTKADGTGLGLSITARIVHAHGGVIESQPKLGRGALFRVVLPVLNAHEAHPDPAHRR
jgi:signal transduction histidine kinase